MIAKTLKRNSCSTRCSHVRPSLWHGRVASRVQGWWQAGLDRRAAQIPVTHPESLGRATMQAPDHRLPHAIASRYTRPNPSPRLGKAKISHAA